MYFAHALVLLELSTNAYIVTLQSIFQQPVDDFSQEECRWWTYSALTDRQTLPFIFCPIPEITVLRLILLLIQGFIQDFLLGGGEFFVDAVWHA